jgi:transcriptional regulator of arginine metabolism
MKTKKDRLSAILELVRQHSFSNQEDILQRLHKKGFEITQATLSRDIKQLKIVKLPDTSGNYTYVVSAKNPYSKKVSTEESGNELTKKGFISIHFSGNLGVIKTRPGYASVIASDIDGKAFRSIMGTIAGDDTILLIPQEKAKRQEILNDLAGIIQGTKN